MKKLTLQQKIKLLLRQKGNWTPSYELEKVNTEWGWIGMSGSRRSRELAESGEIERRQVGKYAEYRIVPKGIRKLLLDDGRIIQQEIYP